MNDVDLWSLASVDSRDASNLMLLRIENGEHLKAVVYKALRKLISYGSPECRQCSSTEAWRMILNPR